MNKKEREELAIRLSEQESWKDALVKLPPERRDRAVGLPEHPKERKKALRRIFNKDEKLVNYFIKCYDEALETGSGVPYERAWIMFRERYTENEEGEWVLE